MNTFFKSKFCGAILYLVSVQALALVMMLTFRMILLITGYENIALIENKGSLLSYSFYLALHFDNIIASYILIIPLFFIPILALLKIFNKQLLRISNIYFILAYTLVFAISCMDIPYFHYFFQHINASIFNWAEYGNETTGMIFAEKSYYLYFLLFFVSIFVFSFLLIFISRKILRYFTLRTEKRQIILVLGILFSGYVICYFGTRGRIRKAGTFEVKNAYFSENSFINQLAINPVFYMYQSFAYNSTVDIALMEQSEALNMAGKELGIDILNGDYIIKKAGTDSIRNRANVVVVMIESFSNDYLDIQVDGKPLMPYLNQLIDSSAYYFDNFYSQGSHTNQGLMASLYGFPSLFERQMMKVVDVASFGRAVLPTPLDDELQKNKGVPTPIYNGLPADLRNKGYETMLLITHTSKFDNFGTFFAANGIDSLYSQESYPESDWNNVWGVNDEYLFNYALSKMDAAYQTGKPFFSGLMTISNHPPIYYSKAFENASKKDDEKAMAYTDYCIKQFLEAASQKDWYNNTIFLFLGDHGKVLGTSNYDMHLSLNHIPLIIYSPLLIDSPKRISDPAGQIDIYATLMGLLGSKPSYNSFGIDLLNKKRDYIYFTSDRQLGCMSNEYFYVHNITSGQQFLYDIKTQKNVLQDHEMETDSMRNYSYSMIESAKYILKNQLKKSE